MNRTFGCIPPELVPNVWNQIEPLIAECVWRENTHDMRDVKLKCFGGLVQVWAQFGDRIEAVAITEIVTYPKCRICRVWMCGAVSGAADWSELAAHIKAWAKTEGMREAEIIGRRGWLRVLSGARQVGVIMREKL